MFPIIRAIAVTVLIWSAVISSPATGAAEEAAGAGDLDRIVAIVNEDVILQSEVNSQLDLLLEQLRQNDTPIPPRIVLERQILERLIIARLQLQVAERAGIQVDDETLNQAVRNIAKNNNLSLPEFRTALESQGIDFASFREDLRKEIIVSRVRAQQVQGQIKVSDQELDAFLASQPDMASGRSAYHLSHILIALPEAPSPEQIKTAREKADKLVAELRAGRDFREAALSVSDGRRALEGGDLGWLQSTEVPTLFVDVAAEMERGEISDPIRSGSGFHVIRLEDYKGGERLLITQTHVRHILIRTSEILSDDEARVRLRQLRERVINGDDFAALARSHSDDQASAIKGGDLGWVSPGALVPAFEREMDTLSPGEISQPFRTEFGWHVAQVIERREHDSTEEIRRTQAREAIRQRKAEEETTLWVRRLRDESYIEYRLEEL